jgi:beta-mannosidase
LQVNDVPVFCRGACWTPLDPVSLSASSDALSHAFDQVVAAGMNMLRVGGMMVYEDDAFLDQCDARGVLLWQDFMFANMDYPEDDADFIQAVNLEAVQLLSRLQGRSSLAVLCGNSEGEQQAAMWGAPRERWHSSLFHERLAALAREACPDVPYWPSSAHGGAFPHQGNAGTTSYYGVGAYLRPIDDARRAEIRFASECLAFANIPDSRSMAHLPGGRGTKVHDPSWKARTPRDLGAGWDFDDVRDHYTAHLYDVDVARLRYADHERYLALGRVVTGEVMAAVFSEWRRRRSPTSGGLVWFLRDLWPGAGWGVIDASGAPKAAWHYLRRALAPVAVSLSDEGGNGLGVHIVNDHARPFVGDLELTLYRFGEVQVARGARPVVVPPRSAIELNAGIVFDDFLDLSYSYRFGPPSHDVVVALLRAGDVKGKVLARAFHFVPALPNAREMDVGLQATAHHCAGDDYRLVVRTRKLAQAVCVELEGFDPDDNYFHLAPGEERQLMLRPTSRKAPNDAPRGTLRALNSEAVAMVAFAPSVSP